MNIWAGLILALTAIGVIGYKVSKLKEGAANISTEMKGRIHSMDFSKVVFAIDVIIKNPSDVKMYILQPFVSILYKDKEIASSNVSDQIIAINPFEPAHLKTIMISAQYMNLTDVAGELMQKLQTKNHKVNLQVKILVNVILGLKGTIPARLKDYTGSKTIVPMPAIIKDIAF